MPLYSKYTMARTLIESENSLEEEHALADSPVIGRRQRRPLPIDGKCMTQSGLRSSPGLDALQDQIGAISDRGMEFRGYGRHAASGSQDSKHTPVRPIFPNANNNNYSFYSQYFNYYNDLDEDGYDADEDHEYQGDTTTTTTTLATDTNNNSTTWITPSTFNSTPSGNFVSYSHSSPTIDRSHHIPNLPNSPLSPRWDSLGYSRPGVALSPTSPAVRSFHSRSSDATDELQAGINSFASESRDAFPELPITKKLNTSEPVRVDNFSRPRNASIKQSYQESPQFRPLNHHPTDPSLLELSPNNSMAWSRDRGQSVSSNMSAATFSSVPGRPPPDMYSREHLRSRGRHPNFQTSRPPISYHRMESSVPPLGREPLARMSSMPSEELRSSYRSQLSVSTGPGTTGTERSSVATKNSSVTSVYGAADDSFSLDDIMGMYEKGFYDDSAPEDNEMPGSRPPTAKSELSRRRTAMLDAMTDLLPTPESPTTPSTPGSVQRHSATTSNDLDTHEFSHEFSQEYSQEYSLEFSPEEMAEEASESTRVGPDIDPWADPIADPKTDVDFDVDTDVAQAHVDTNIDANIEASIEAQAEAQGEAQGEVEAEVEAEAKAPADIETDDDDDDFKPSPPTREPTGLTIAEDNDERDRYGFRKSNQYVTREQYDEWNQGYKEYLDRRRKKWVVFLREHGLMTDQPNRFPPRSNKTKRFVRKGIPPDWRGSAWFYYAGGPAVVAKHAGTYESLLKQKAKDVDIEAIERDLHRTFPDNVKFRSAQMPSMTGKQSTKRESEMRTDEKPMILALRRVLRAFAIYNPKIGYCQSLNFLAGLLLLFVETEEHAFWLLNIITRVYLPGTHETSLEGANVDLGVLMSSLRESMPQVWGKIGGELDGTDVVWPKTWKHRHMKSETTRLPPITLCMTAWFMSCYIGTLPIESTLRVWDVFFYEGSKTLFRIALAIFKIGENEIKAVGDPMEIFQVVQTIPRRLVDANGLIEACFRRRNGFGHLSQDTVEQKRQERRTQVKAEREKLAANMDGPGADMGIRKKGTLFGRH